jgi:hypothetical protein
VSNPLLLAFGQIEVSSESLRTRSTILVHQRMMVSFYFTLPFPGVLEVTSI